LSSSVHSGPYFALLTWGSARTAALRRSVHIRHLAAGSDGSEEWEIQALLGPVYDIHRLGVFFTASPRHADVLLVTGAGARGMAGPLRTTYGGMPDRCPGSRACALAATVADQRDHNQRNASHQPQQRRHCLLQDPALVHPAGR
jgi:Ni,Fe-hydrogenase III small subunit